MKMFETVAHIYRIFFCVVFTLVYVNSASAFDISAFKHVQTPVESGGNLEGIQLETEAAGIKKIRVLSLSNAGYRITPMMREGQHFRASLRFGEWAALKYQFQFETEKGKIFESQYFFVRMPTEPGLEKQIAALEEEAKVWQAKIKQHENALHSLETTDPEQLTKRKDQEYGRALVKLGRKEREIEEAKQLTDLSLLKLQDKIKAADEAADVEQAKKFLENMGISVEQRGSHVE